VGHDRRPGVRRCCPLRRRLGRSPRAGHRAVRDPDCGVPRFILRLTRLPTVRICLVYDCLYPWTVVARALLVPGHGRAPLRARS
jgi:hypothetical protein